jgi:hypothetical protein
MATQSELSELIELYVGYFGRAADPEGLNFWAEVIDSGGSLDITAIANDFATQEEAIETYPSLKFPGIAPIEDFVTEIYQNLFNRDPDSAGLTFWADAIDSGAVAIGEAVVSIIQGATNSPAGQDLDTLENKVEAAFDWTQTAASIPGFSFTEENEDGETVVVEEFKDAAQAAVAGVDETTASVDAAKAATNAFRESQTTSPAPVADYVLTGGTDNLLGTSLDETFDAESGELDSADRIDGAGGQDTLQVFEDLGFDAVSPTVSNVETFVFTNQSNDLTSTGDNNVGGYSNADGTTQVDVEVDAGRMRDVTRWEDYDSRADLVIEDARDSDDSDGTFTGDITVAMVSTDPGNVDYAIYFDDPVNTSQNQDSIFIELIDQNNSTAYDAGAITAATTGNLTDSKLEQFAFLYDGEEVTVELDEAVVGSAFFGPDASYAELRDAINTALANTDGPDGSPLGDDVTASINGTFDENIGDDNAGEATNTDVFGLRIELTSASGAELGDAGPGDIIVTQLNDPADIASSVTAEQDEAVELIRLNVDLDDVGKGSMGGDLLAGAMSTGRQGGDDRTSDSVGIQQFDIEVDRSSQLQTINSTNNTLEVVNITSGDNDTARGDEDSDATGDLTVRGQAAPDVFVATDGPMPGAAPQHNSFGLSDVRLVDASDGMNGRVDITAELTDEIVEKYLNLQDANPNQDLDDVNFTYSLSDADKEGEDDELFLEMSANALADAGTGSREDFILNVEGNGGDDAITTLVGNAFKAIDQQGQDYYVYDIFSNPGAIFGGPDVDGDGLPDWYENHIAGDSSELNVDGGAGADEIWTVGFGDYVIDGGAGNDVIFSDNSGVNRLDLSLDGNIGRQVGEHRQSDYYVGAVWTFNDVNGGDGVVSNIQSDANDQIFTAATSAEDRDYRVTVSYNVQNMSTLAAPNGNPETAFTSTVTLNLAAGESYTDADLNQAIKDAVNNNAKLSAVLEAQDGPGNSLAVYSKLDGAFQDIGNLSVEITELDANGDVASVVANVAAEDFQNFGADSLATQASVITPGSGDDVVTLSTAFGVTQEINYDDNFGADTLYHFQPGLAADGSDLLDFTSFRPTDGSGNALAATVSAGAISTADGSVSIVEETATNDETAEVADFYNGTADDDLFLTIVYDTAVDNNAEEGAHVEGNNNTGTVYLVEGGSDATASALGSIDLIGVDWETLTADNFVTGA